jgi:hypothetical protein
MLKGLPQRLFIARIKELVAALEQRTDRLANREALDQKWKGRNWAAVQRDVKRLRALLRRFTQSLRPLFGVPYTPSNCWGVA